MGKHGGKINNLEGEHYKIQSTGSKRISNDYIFQVDCLIVELERGTRG